MSVAIMGVAWPLQVAGRCQAIFTTCRIDRPRRRRCSDCQAMGKLTASSSRPAEPPPVMAGPVDGSASRRDIVAQAEAIWLVRLAE